MKKGFFMILVIFLAAGFNVAMNPGPVTGVEGLDELKKEKGLFKTTLINPNADFSSYNKVCPKRVLLQFRSSGPPKDEAIAGSMVRRRSRDPVVPDDHDLETFRQIVNDALVSELGSCELLELVEEDGPETLFVRATVTDIVTDIALKSAKPGQSPKPYSVKGDIVFDLIDAETGIILARFGEPRKSGSGRDAVEPPDAGAEWANIWVWAEQAAADLRQELERVLDEDRG